MSNGDNTEPGGGDGLEDLRADLIEWVRVADTETIERVHGMWEDLNLRNCARYKADEILDKARAGECDVSAADLAAALWLNQWLRPDTLPMGRPGGGKVT